jgi:polysaccharide deacetylase family protein (PEP-CTERM system associated)
MLNAISIDLEDWFCTYNIRINIIDWDKCELRIIKNTHILLDLFEKNHIKATFFVLGWIAERVPELIKEIETKGHEIASHGYSHKFITQMTKTEFEDDIKKSLNVLSKCTTSQINGFRAPSFTITKNTLWAIDILLKYGFKYDSSVFPVSFHPDYGFPNSQLNIYNLNGIIEVPLSVVKFFGKNIPCSGGGYFRLYPYWLSEYLINTCIKQNRPFIFYLHPWELDYEQPKKYMPFIKRYRHYNNLKKTEPRLNKLLKKFEFTTIKDIIKL